LGSIADIARHLAHVCFTPEADIHPLGRAREMVVHDPENRFALFEIML
jgi:hypothetical protein